MSMRRKTCLLYVVSKIKKTLYLCVFMINLFALGSVDAMAGWTTIDVPGAYGAKPTKAYGIDGSNIVGTYGDASGGQHGFLYNGSSWTTLDMPGASETFAHGIDGSNIVGQYFDASGGYHGFVYVIPEPATLLLLALGGLALIRRRR